MSKIVNFYYFFILLLIKIWYTVIPRKRSGSTAKTISNLKPKALVLGLCPDQKAGRRLALNWGVYPVVIPFCNSTDEILEESMKAAREFLDLNKGDIVITTGGFPIDGDTKPTNLMKIEMI